MWCIFLTYREMMAEDFWMEPRSLKWQGLMGLPSSSCFVFRPTFIWNAVFDIVCHKTGCIGFLELVEQKQSGKAGATEGTQE